MKPLEIAKGIYNVGVNDWNIRDFHGYSTHEGTSYNAFLIMDEKIALIDTVKKEFADQLIHNISQIVDPKKIDLVISNHTEMDHSGGLARIMHRIGEDKPLYCSKMGLKSLSRHFKPQWNYQAVGSGQELNLGQKNLLFLETRMVHWPDSMFTYLKEDKILFSSDGFGQHYAGQEMFDDEIGDAIMPHAKKYFANILTLYAPLILKLIESVQSMGLEFNMICPDHGILWRKDPGPRGVLLTNYDKLEANGGVAPARWSFDGGDWWLEENGVIMEAPEFSLPDGKYVVTGNREVVSILTVHPADENGEKRWELDKDATLYDVTHLRCRSARYTPATSGDTCSPSKAELNEFPVAPGGAMPPVESCHKQDYTVLFVIGLGVET